MSQTCSSYSLKLTLQKLASSRNFFCLSKQNINNSVQTIIQGQKTGIWLLTGKLNLKFSSFGFESSPVDTLLSKDSYKLNDETIYWPLTLFDTTKWPENDFWWPEKKMEKIIYLRYWLGYMFSWWQGIDLFLFWYFSWFLAIFWSARPKWCGFGHWFVPICFWLFPI